MMLNDFPLLGFAVVSDVVNNIYQGGGTRCILFEPRISESKTIKKFLPIQEFTGLKMFIHTCKKRIMPPFYNIRNIPMLKFNPG